MIRLSHVVFHEPIPIPKTHVRQAAFCVPEWEIWDDDGCIRLASAAVSFHTYAPASCAIMFAPEPPPAPPTETEPATPKAKRGRK